MKYIPNISFHANDIFLYPPKTSKIPVIFWCFQEVQEVKIGGKGI